MRKLRNIIIALIFLSVAVVGYAFFSQLLLSHKDISFIPDYPKTELTEKSDFEEIYMQTGLSKISAEKIIGEQGFEGLLEYQNKFFGSREIKCKSVFGFWTKSDRIKDKENEPKIADLQPGDILLTLSNHSLGWRHGHAGIAIDNETVLESAQMGVNSDYYDASDWEEFSQFAVLRLKAVTPEMQAEIVSFAKEKLCNIPYRLSVGCFGEKAPSTDSNGFGVHCDYLVWYIYNHFGFDIDSDGGKIVTTYDILNSPLLEVVQLYGIDPREYK